MHPAERGGFLRSKKPNQSGDQAHPSTAQGFPGSAGRPRGPHGQPHMRPMQPWGASQNLLHGRPGPAHLDHRPHASAARPPMHTPATGRPFQPRPPTAHPSSGFHSKQGMTGLPRGMAAGPPAQVGTKRGAAAMAAEAPLPPPRPPSRAKTPPPRGPVATPTMLKASGPDFREFANVTVTAAEVSRVSHLERLRAMNALAGVGGAAKVAHSPAAMKAAAAAFRSGDAFRGSVFADDVSELVPDSVATAGPDE